MIPEHAARMAEASDDLAADEGARAARGIAIGAVLALCFWIAVFAIGLIADLVIG